MAETKKTTSTKKTGAKKAPVKTTTPRKKTTTKSSTTKKSGTTPKKTSIAKPKTTKPKQSTSTKPKTSTVSKTSSAKSRTVKPKMSSKGVKTIETIALDSTKPKTVTKKNSPKSATKSTVIKKSSTASKKKTSVKKAIRVKKPEELTTLEVVEQKIEGKEIVERKPLGKTFYLIFSIVFYLGSFFYINTYYFENGDLVQSALFSLAALFIVFVLILFNIHRIVLGFFALPFRRMMKQARHEVSKEIFFSVGKNKIQTTFNKYRTIFTLVLYMLIAGLLLYATISEGIDTHEPVLSVIMKSLSTELLFISVLCSWQYLFNILPEVLDETIDAKNGYILTLSAFVMIIFVVFNIFNITYLSEIMIFILIIGFVALLGVNLNMIVGEINIFSNIRNRRDKTVTRLVFTIFFAFHIYVILYASVVAFSIYQWDNDSFNFSSNPTKREVVDDVFDSSGNEVTESYYYNLGTTTYQLITNIYNSDGDVISDYLDDDNVPPSRIYASNGQLIETFYSEVGNPLDTLETGDGTYCIEDSIYYDEDGLGCFKEVPIPHEYGDFLYWTVISVSTIGYGDVSPSTEFPIAMGWGAFLGLYGLTFFALSISFVSNIAIEGYSARKEE